MAAELVTEDEKFGLKYELSLDRSDLRSHAWYHGSIGRPQTESLLAMDGDFVVRESASRPGDFVLSTKWKSNFLHFVVSKVVVQPETIYERIQYTFEGDYFETIPDLITFYIGHRRPISKLSGAIISQPVNRKRPISSKSMAPSCERNSSAFSRSESMSSRSSLRRSLSRTSDRITPVDPVPRELNFINREALGATMQRNSILSLGSISLSSNDSAQPKHDPDQDYEAMYTNSSAKANNSGGSSDSAFSSICSMSDFYDSPRVSFVGSKRSSGADVNIGSDTSYDFPRTVGSCHKSLDDDYECIAEYDTPRSFLLRQPSLVGAGGNGPSIERTFSDRRLPEYDTPRAAVCCSSNRMSSPVAELVGKFTEMPRSGSGLKRIIEVPTMTQIRPHEFFSFLIPLENKPLDQSALTKVHSVLRSTNARLLSVHMTRSDLEFFGLYDDIGATSSLELIPLPQATRVRRDILERADCTKYFVATTILTLAGAAERAEVMSKWVKVAFESKAGIGNLHGFTAIVEGLTLEPVARLTATWAALRCNHTTDAVAFESSLRPVLKAMKDRKNPEAPNTCLPHLVTIVRSLAEHELFSDREPRIDSADATKSYHKARDLLEKIKADTGLEQLRTNIQVASCLASSTPMLRRNGRSVLDGMAFEDLLLDMFKTEFHRRLLWGFKGSNAESLERFEKLDKVLELMSLKCEPDSGSAV